MNLFKNLFGKKIPVRKHEAGFIIFGDDEYRLEQGPTKVSLTFEEGETPQETLKKMKQRMRENGVKIDYLLEKHDMFYTPIQTGVRLWFYQRANPKVWKFYGKVDGKFAQIGEADLSEADAIEWALKKIKEQ